MAPAEANVALFSYGTLQLPAVQLANYGRLVAGARDRLRGYILADIVIADPSVTRISGKSIHLIARATGNLTDAIDGIVLMLTAAELELTDAYETDDYERVELVLESGRTAFAYVEARRG